MKLIRIDGGTQQRAEVNNETVQEYAEAIKAGAVFPPIVLFYDSCDYWLADGFTRYLAHVAAGMASIPAETRIGTLYDAIWYSTSVDCNGTHGQSLNNADKRKKVAAALAHPNSASMSDNAIARHVGVSGHFVGAVRASLQSDHSEDSTSERTYTTKHGTKATMRTGGIGKKNAGAVESDSTADTGAQAAASKPALSVVQPPAEDEYTDLDAALDQIEGLQDALVIANLGNVSDEDKGQAATLIGELRARIKVLEQSIKAIKTSPDTYQAENVQLHNQVNRQRREIDRVTGGRTA